MHRGFIKIWRKLEDSAIYDDNVLIGVFIKLLIDVNWKEKKTIFNGKELIIPRGSLVFGRKKFALKYRLNENTLYKKIKILEKAGICNIKCNNRFSIISIINYNSYHDENIEHNSQRNNCLTTTEQPHNSHVTHLKKLKKLEEVKRNIYVFDFDTIYKIYPRQEGGLVGIAKLKKSIKTQEQYDALKNGVENYTDAKVDSEMKYIKTFNNFVKDKVWLDYQVKQPKNKFRSTEW